MKQESILFALEKYLKVGPYAFYSMIVFRTNSIGYFMIIYLNFKDFVKAEVGSIANL